MRFDCTTTSVLKRHKSNISCFSLAKIINNQCIQANKNKYSLNEKTYIGSVRHGREVRELCIWALGKHWLSNTRKQ